MARLQHELFINAPPERVFAVLAEPERTLEYSPNVLAIRRTSEGPIGVGSTTDVVVKALGVEQHAVGRCMLFDPPRRLVIDSQTRLGARSRSDTQLIPERGGTLLRASLEYVVPGGGVGKLLDRLVAERQTRQYFELGLARLKQLVEAEAVTGCE